jgi:hypothetical protein
VSEELARERAAKEAARGCRQGRAVAQAQGLALAEGRTLDLVRRGSATSRTPEKWTPRGPCCSRPRRAGIHS